MAVQVKNIHRRVYRPDKLRRDPAFCASAHVHELYELLIYSMRFSMSFAFHGAHAYCRELCEAAQVKGLSHAEVVALGATGSLRHEAISSADLSQACPSFPSSFNLSWRQFIHAYSYVCRHNAAQRWGAIHVHVRGMYAS